VAFCHGKLTRWGVSVGPPLFDRVIALLIGRTSDVFRTISTEVTKGIVGIGAKKAPPDGRRPGREGKLVQQAQQQTGVLFIIMQQVQPDFIIVVMQSQHAWIMSQHALSPLVQVTQQPSLVISTLHMPMVRLQQQTIMPFIIMQQETIPPASIWQRFCIMAQAWASPQEQVIFMPPVHFSIFMVQRGTISQLLMVGIEPVPPAVVGFIPGIVIPGRSIIIVGDMVESPSN
jgi:hypothetical protein